MTPLDYVRLNLTLVPWIPNHAGTYIRDFSLPFHTSSEKDIIEWESKWSKIDWAVIPRQHVVLDLERKKGLDGPSMLSELAKMAGDDTFDSVLEKCPIASTRNNGLHVWFAAPADCKLVGQLSVAPGVEIKYKNGQVHVPPSSGYEWRKPMRACEEIPVPPSWLVKLWGEVSRKRTEGKNTTPDRIPAGDRHNTLAVLASRLRSLNLGKEEIKASLMETVKLRCDNPESVDAKEIDKIADYYSKREAKIDVIGAAIEGDESAKTTIAMIMNMRKADTSEKEETDTSEKEETDTTEKEETETVEQPAKSALDYFKNEFNPMPSSVPYLSKWVEWVNSRAIKPQPELTCLSYLSVVSVIAGRNYSWRGVRPNIYCCGLAPTGQGKEWVLQATRHLVELAGFKDILSDDRFRSHEGVVTELKLKPSIMWLQDEITEFFDRIMSKNPPDHLVSVVGLLLKIYGSFRYEENALAKSSREEIKDIFASWYCTSQPLSFRNNISSRLINNGFFNRIIYCMPKHVYQDPDKDSCEDDLPPDEIVQMLIKFKTDVDDVINRRARNVLGLTVMDGEDDVNEVRKQFIRETNKIEELAVEQDDTVMLGLVPRRDLNAYKIAMLHAILRNPSGPIMTVDSLRWGYSISDQSISIIGTMAKNKTKSARDEENESKFTNLLNYITISGRIGRTIQDIAGKFRVMPRDMDGMLTNLINSGDICINTSTTNGKDISVFIATKYKGVNK